MKRIVRRTTELYVTETQYRQYCYEMARGCGPWWEWSRS